MARQLITTHEMEGMRVLGGKKGTSRIGKVRRTVFHPTEKRVVGFIIKRPDLLWMFHRKDKFVAIDGFDLEDGRMVIKQDPAATDNAACKRMGVNYDECILWVGLPVMTQDGQAFGVVGNVEFDLSNGDVVSFATDSGMANNALLGRRNISADAIKGFRRGMGTALKTPDVEGEEVELGAMLVDDSVKDLVAEGGVAEKAGKATAVAMDKVHNVTESVSEKAGEVAEKTGELAQKGAYATGKQLKRSTTMFSDFKKEYNKAVGKPEAKPQSKSTPASGATKAASTNAASKAGSAPATGTKASSTAKSSSTKPAATSSKTATKTTTTAKKTTTTKKPAQKQKGMFASFKDEYNKGRYDK